MPRNERALREFPSCNSTGCQGLYLTSRAVRPAKIYVHLGKFEKFPCSCTRCCEGRAFRDVSFKLLFLPFQQWSHPQQNPVFMRYNGGTRNPGGNSIAVGRLITRRSRDLEVRHPHFPRKYFPSGKSIDYTGNLCVTVGSWFPNSR